MPADTSEAAFTEVKSRKRKMNVDSEDSKRPCFPAVKPENLVKKQGKSSIKVVDIPPNRIAPLKNNWKDGIMEPLVKYLKLQVRYNIQKRQVEMKTCSETTDIGALQKGADFVKAFALGFDVKDALTLIRLDSLFLDSFEVKDVKMLNGDHLSRAIGRIAGSGGKVKFTIENVTKTRIVLADSKVHILGSYTDIRTARTAICQLIMGSPPSKIYGNMRAVANRTSERF